jgi:hypothetical protein
MSPAQELPQPSTECHSVTSHRRLSAVAPIDVVTAAIPGAIGGQGGVIQCERDCGSACRDNDLAPNFFWPAILIADVSFS